jgi:hypothetical protein
MRSPAFDDIAGYGVYFDISIGKGGKIIVFPFVLKELGSPTIFCKIRELEIKWCFMMKRNNGKYN